MECDCLYTFNLQNNETEGKKIAHNTHTHRELANWAHIKYS